MDIQHFNMEGMSLAKWNSEDTYALEFNHRNRSVCWISRQTNEKTKEMQSYFYCAKAYEPNSRWILPKIGKLFMIQKENILKAFYYSLHRFFQFKYGYQNRLRLVVRQLVFLG